jgi:hypothetical protein
MPLDGTARAKRAMSKVIRHLEVLEKHGVDQIGVPRKRQPPPGVDQEAADAAMEVFRLRVSRATRLGAPKPGETASVFVSLSGGPSSNFDMLNALVEKCAHSKVHKLRAAAGDERHLLVWMRGSVSDAELAMAALPPPPTAADLPDGIDVVWVATFGAGGRPFERLWRLQPPGGWENIGTLIRLRRDSYKGAARLPTLLPPGLLPPGAFVPRFRPSVRQDRVERDGALFSAKPSSIWPAVCRPRLPERAKAFVPSLGLLTRRGVVVPGLNGPQPANAYRAQLLARKTGGAGQFPHFRSPQLPELGQLVRAAGTARLPGHFARALERRLSPGQRVGHARGASGNRGDGAYQQPTYRGWRTD